MNKTLFFLISLLFIFSCIKNKQYPILDTNQINGKILWERIIKEENYEKYPMWPGFEGIQLGQSPHGRYHEIYINSILRNSLPIKDKIAPDGTIIVKRNYTADKKFSNLTVMIKVKDYNPEHGDWFWVYYEKDGNISAEGIVDMCISCHDGMKENDYIIVRPLDKLIEQKE